MRPTFQRHRPQIEIVGEIAKMVELGIGPNAKKANLDEKLTRSVKVLRGLEATYSEHGSTTREKPGNRSKSGACNHRESVLPPVAI